MTPTPKDLKNAQEFVQRKESKAISDMFCYYDNGMLIFCSLHQYLAKYLLHEVAAGRVKFTGNREEV